MAQIKILPECKQLCEAYKSLENQAAKAAGFIFGALVFAKQLRGRQ